MVHQGRLVLRIAAEIVCLTSIYVLTFVGIGWFLSDAVGLSTAGVAALLVAPIAITLMAATRGYYAWYERQYLRHESVLPAGALSQVMFLLFLSAVLVVLTTGSLYFQWRRNYTVVILLAFLAICVALAVWWRLRQPLEGSPANRSNERISTFDIEIQNKQFERIYRIIVFSFALASPAVLAVVFFLMGESETAVVFTIITLLAGAFAVPKIRLELSQSGN